jgi:hypothetical protein
MEIQWAFRNVNLNLNLTANQPALTIIRMRPPKYSLAQPQRSSVSDYRTFYCLPVGILLASPPRICPRRLAANYSV